MMMIDFRDCDDWCHLVSVIHAGGNDTTSPSPLNTGFLGNAVLREFNCCVMLSYSDLLILMGVFFHDV